jgi:hypothetical protein
MNCLVNSVDEQRILIYTENDFSASQAYWTIGKDKDKRM